jgi:quercetin dioxygenase-like cupin family protein
MKRAVRWALVSVGLAGVVTAMTVAPGGATPPSGLTNIPLARGTNTTDGSIPLKAGSDVALAQITVNPGGSSGWHSHPGGAIVVVQQGSLTVYESVGSKCETTTYTAGQAFI